MSRRSVVLAAVVVFLLAGATIFGFLMWKHTSEMKPVSVSLMVKAEGWSEETSSPIPLHITGQTENKEKVDEKYFVGKSDKNLALKPGSYEIEVYASPVTEAGGMYRVAEPVKIDISKNASNAKCKCLPSAKITLSPISVNEVTDEEIEKAQAAMKEAGLSEKEINTFIDTARKARQAELDRIEKERKAKEEAKRAKEEAEKRAKEYGKLAGQYLGLAGVDGEGYLHVSPDGSAVYKFWQYRSGPASGQCYAAGGDAASCRGKDGKEYFEYPLTFTMAGESAPGYYLVTFAEGFNYAYSNSGARQDIEPGRLMGINVNDPNTPEAFTPNPGVDF